MRSNNVESEVFNMPRPIKYIHKVREPVGKNMIWGKWINSIHPYYDTLEDAIANLKQRSFGGSLIQHGIFYKKRLVGNTKDKLWLDNIKERVTTEQRERQETKKNLMIR